MRSLYFDCFAGISGDMIVGALLDLGASLERIERELSKITLPKYEITAEPTTRRGFAATKFTVRTGKEEAARDWNEIRELIENSGLNEDLQVEIVSVFRRLAQAEAKVHGSTL
ncbi:MAG: LarC family nickel insertion protein, partial [Chloroflexi bacterium]|nr:LarC family nickel insertion protein [Chloroflexota bacterium]